MAKPARPSHPYQGSLLDCDPRHRSPQQHIDHRRSACLVSPQHVAPPSLRPSRSSALALSACTGSGGGDSESGAAVDTSKLIIGLESDMAALGYDPVRYSTGQRMFYEGIYDSLFVLDQDGQVVPQLVTSFEYNEDSTQLTLDLDTSATFDDGSTLTR